VPFDPSAEAGQRPGGPAVPPSAPGRRQLPNPPAPPVEP